MTQKQEYNPEPPSTPKPAQRKKPEPLQQEAEPSGFTRLGSRNSAPVPPSSPRRKDDFFDQKPAQKDYSFVSDNLSTTTDQDTKSDLDSDKPVYSARDYQDPKLHQVSYKLFKWRIFCKIPLYEVFKNNSFCSI